MANVQFTVGSGSYYEASGAGTDVDPHVVAHNVKELGGTAITTNAGNVDAGTQRVAIATDDVNLAAIKTAVELIDNAIAGSEMQVDIVSSALPAGAATEATLAAIKTAVELIDNAISGTEMQVDIVSGSVGITGAVDTELPAAAALATAAANPTAPAVGAFGMVYNGTTWDRLPGTAADGVTVNLGANNDVTVAGVATEATLGTINTAVAAIQTAVELIDNAISGTEMQVDIVSGSVGITGTVDTELPAAGALTDNSANPTAPAVGAFGMLWDGATWDRMKGDATDGVLVNLGTNNDVTVAGVATETTLDAIKTAVELLDNIVAGSEAQVDVVTSALPTGAATETTLAAIQTAVELIDNAISGSEMQVDIVGALPAGSATIGKVEVDARTTGGADHYRFNDADESEDEIKASAATVYGWAIHNSGAATVFIQLYNATAANVTVGTTTPDITFGIPAGASANLLGLPGIEFSTALTIAATTGHSDAGAPGANEVTGTIFYK